MQYQVYNEETGELIAWIDTKSDDGIMKKGYAIKKGENLSCVENYPKVRTLFEKVSFDEYFKGCTSPEVITSIPLVTEGIEQHYSKLRLPERKAAGSAGYDFIIPYDLIIPAGKTVTIPTGIKASMADDLMLMLYPRSSLGFKYQLTMNDTVGIIDSDYYNNEGNEGHIFVKMTNHSDKDCCIPEDSAYCQGVFQQFFVTDNDNAVEKRVGGMGSTDKR